MRLAVSWALALACFLPFARAQETLSQDFVQQLVIGPGTLRQLKDIAGLDNAQHAAARELFDAALGEMTRRSRRYFRENTLRFVDRFGSDDAEEQTGSAEIEQSVKEMVADLTRLERDLLNDWKALLTPAQAESWPRFERARRRLLLDTYSSVPDLSKEVARLRVLPEFADPFALALDAYERELDEILLELRRVDHTARTTDRKAYWTMIQGITIRITETSVRHAGTLDRYFHPDDRGLLKATTLGGAVDHGFNFDALLSGFRDLRGTTPEQRAAMDRLALRALADFHAAAPEYTDFHQRSWLGEEVDQAAYAAAESKARAAARPIRRKLLADVRAILTPAQLTAYDDGSDPAGVQLRSVGED